MEDMLKSVDKWFLILSVILLGSYFLWSVRSMLNDLKQSIVDLKETIDKLFDLKNDHESRIRALEVRMEVCNSCNGKGHQHRRMTDEDD